MSRNQGRTTGGALEDRQEALEDRQEVGSYFLDEGHTDVMETPQQHVRMEQRQAPHDGHTLNLLLPVTRHQHMDMRDPAILISLLAAAGCVLAAAGCVLAGCVSPVLQVHQSEALGQSLLRLGERTWLLICISLLTRAACRELVWRRHTHTIILLS